MLAEGTKILTVHDGPKKIEELKEKELVFSYNPETRLNTVDEVEKLYQIPGGTFIHKITFDSGLELFSTSDQEFILFRGQIILANKLKEQSAVKAFSSSIHRDGHFRVHGFVVDKARHQYVARMVWEFFNGKVPGDLIIHHKNFEKLDNHIENLELLTNSLHNSVHYPYRKDGGFFRGRNHKVVSISPSYFDNKIVYMLELTKKNFVVVPDEIPIGPTMLYSGIITKFPGS